MMERRIDIAAPSGVMVTFVSHPSAGGPFPTVMSSTNTPQILTKYSCD